jgi:hypothetical protein
MALGDGLTTREIADVFSAEIAAAGGTVSDAFDDGDRLFMRAILPAEREVKARDRVQGGVALQASEFSIWVHPYVFRQVCSNGAIIAHATESCHLTRSDVASESAEAHETALRNAITACCSDSVFAKAADEMRSSVRSRIDFALTFMPMLSRLPLNVSAKLVGAIMDRFLEGQDTSRFGLMNAVTSVARDTRDPEMRWHLEKLGGRIPVEIQPRKRQFAMA